MLLIIGSPVVFAIGAAAWMYFIIKPGMIELFSVYVHKLFTGMDSFILLCIPLFVMAGEIMKKNGMTEDLIKFLQLIVGRTRGGMAYVNVLASMLFGGMTGSGLADVSALGPLEIEAMKQDGYPLAFSAALTATSAIQGPIIPPSIPMVIFSSLTNASIGALFLGGAIPGILIGFGQMTVIRIFSKRRNFPKHEMVFTWKEFFMTLKSTVYSLVMPLIILGGIIGGFFTPTEAAAIAVGYALFVTIFIFRERRKLSLNDLREILKNTGQTAAKIYLIIAFVSVIGWIFAIEQVPYLVSNYVSKSNFSVHTLLFLVNLFFLFNGMWISDMIQLLLFAPIFTPIFMKLGIHPVHFGVIMVVNVMISMITPPYGQALYLASAISGSELKDIVIETIPFTIVSIVVLFLVTYFPFIVMSLPHFFKLV